MTEEVETTIREISAQERKRKNRQYLIVILFSWIFLVWCLYHPDEIDRSWKEVDDAIKSLLRIKD